MVEAVKGAVYDAQVLEVRVPEMGFEVSENLPRTQFQVMRSLLPVYLEFIVFVLQRVHPVAVQSEKAWVLDKVCRRSSN